jgi:hypothetical protein
MSHRLNEVVYALGAKALVIQPEHQANRHGKYFANSYATQAGGGRGMAGRTVIVYAVEEKQITYISFRFHCGELSANPVLRFSQTLRTPFPIRLRSGSPGQRQRRF